MTLTVSSLVLAVLSWRSVTLTVDGKFLDFPVIVPHPPHDSNSSSGSRALGGVQNFIHSLGNSSCDKNISRQRSIETYDCNHTSGLENECILVSNSSNKINTSDAAVNEAHNYAIDVHDFYKTLFGRDSMDGCGMPIRSLVHWGVNFGAGQGEGRFFYGDSIDSLCLETVAWLFSSHVIWFDGRFAWEFESGTLSAAFNDIMGAVAERLYKNKSIEDTWRLYEDCDNLYHRGWRSMANPPEFGLPDHYDDRYEDEGGIYWNTGIVDKAFYLMVTGGTHPKSGVMVPPLDVDFDKSITAGAKIVYNALTMCLISTSDFLFARECTLKFADSNQTESVAKAWDAVGVMAPVYANLSSGIPLTGLSCGLIGETKDQLFFRMNRLANMGLRVTCKLIGPNGNPDLYVKFGRRPVGKLGSDCSSVTNRTYEACTTPPAPNNTEVYVTVEARVASTHMTLECYMISDCKTKNKKCIKSKDCCGSMVCDGPSKTRRVCKPPIHSCPSWSLFCNPGHPCTRNTQCPRGHKCNGKHRCI